MVVELARSWGQRVWHIVQAATNRMSVGYCGRLINNDRAVVIDWPEGKQTDWGRLCKTCECFTKERS